MADNSPTPGSDLIPRNSQTPEVRIIPIANIRPSRHQARKVFGEDGLLSLALSMDQEGLMQAITVRDLGDGYELISGERRLRAAKKLGWTTIEAKVIHPVSEGEAAAKGLIENLQRENLTPLEEAEGFRDILNLNDAHWDHGQIAKMIGRTRTYVISSLALLSLTPEVMEIFRDLNLSRSHGQELLRLRSPELQLKAAKDIENLKLSWEATRRMVDSLLGIVKRSKSVKIDDSTRNLDKSQTSPTPAGYVRALTSPGESEDSATSVHPIPEPTALPTEEEIKGELLVQLENSTKLKPLDPMREGWNRAQQNSTLASLCSINVAYGGSLTWSLRMQLHEASPAEKQPVGRLLAASFAALAKAIDLPAEPLQALRTEVPIPTIQEARYVAGNKMQLKWAPLGEGFRYRLFEAFERDTPKFTPVGDGLLVSPPGLIVNLSAGNFPNRLLAVTAVDPEGNESELSQSVQFDLRPGNKEDKIDPISGSSGSPVVS